MFVCNKLSSPCTNLVLVTFIGEKKKTEASWRWDGWEIHKEVSGRESW